MNDITAEDVDTVADAFSWIDGADQHFDKEVLKQRLLNLEDKLRNLAQREHVARCPSIHPAQVTVGPFASFVTGIDRSK